MFDMMHTPDSRGAGTRGSGIRKAALAAAASLTMAFGAAATAPTAAAVPEPSAPDVTGKCDENLPPADPHAAIGQAIAEGHISPNHDWQPNKAMPYLEGPCHQPTAQPISARGGGPDAVTAHSAGKTAQQHGARPVTAPSSPQNTRPSHWKEDMFRTNDAIRTNDANRTTADVTDAITADAGATHTRRPRRAGTLTASAAAALALMAGGAAPAVAAPATDAAPAAEAAGAPAGDSRLKEAIGQATRDGHISAGHEWVADPWFPVARGTDGSVSAQVITVAGATDSSPQAVLLYGPNDGGYAGTAAVPEGFGADRAFGDRTGQVESVSVIGMDAVKVTWKGPDGQTKDVTYRQP